jgi:hypothetical protein
MENIVREYTRAGAERGVREKWVAGPQGVAAANAVERRAVNDAPQNTDRAT